MSANSLPQGFAAMRIWPTTAFVCCAVILLSARIAQSLPTICGKRLPWRVGSHDFVEESKGFVLFVAFMPLFNQPAHDQMKKFKELAERLKQVRFVVIAPKDDDLRNVERFRREFAPITFEIDNDDDNVWNTLQIQNNDILVYDRCGRLSVSIRSPRSNILEHQEPVNSLYSAMNYARCGWCKYDTRSKTIYLPELQVSSSVSGYFTGVRRSTACGDVQNTVKVQTIPCVSRFSKRKPSESPASPPSSHRMPPHWSSPIYLDHIRAYMHPWHSSKGTKEDLSVQKTRKITITRKSSTTVDNEKSDNIVQVQFTGIQPQSIHLLDQQVSPVPQTSDVENEATRRTTDAKSGNEATRQSSGGVSSHDKSTQIPERGQLLQTSRPFDVRAHHDQIRVENANQPQSVAKKSDRPDVSQHYSESAERIHSEKNRQSSASSEPEPRPQETMGSRAYHRRLPFHYPQRDEHPSQVSSDQRQQQYNDRNTVEPVHSQDQQKSRQTEYTTHLQRTYDYDSRRTSQSVQDSTTEMREPPRGSADSGRRGEHDDRTRDQYEVRGESREHTQKWQSGGYRWPEQPVRTHSAEHRMERPSEVNADVDRQSALRDEYRESPDFVERRRQEAERILEEQRRLEERRQLEEQRRIEEERRRDEQWQLAEQRRLEQQRMIEERRIADVIAQRSSDLLSHNGQSRDSGRSASTMRESEAHRTSDDQESRAKEKLQGLTSVYGAEDDGDEYVDYSETSSISRGTTTGIPPLRDQIPPTQAPPTEWPGSLIFDEIPCAAFTDQICHDQVKKNGIAKRPSCCKKGVYFTDICIPGKCSDETTQICCAQKFLQAKFQCCHNDSLSTTAPGDQFSRCCFENFVDEDDLCCPPSLSRHHWRSVHEICLPNVRADLHGVRLSADLGDGQEVALDFSSDKSWDFTCPRFEHAPAQFSYIPENDDNADDGDNGF
ncbi:hypothetical protein AB6A40_003130 [Gnathostoma spinigerum]|uniref:Selenoprotein P N-terminal domain-containing protein n=1 Tax=Gnathostoma spinigerum TaxID=75299 RepID=A0ABD6EGA1_9BILA